MDQCWDMKSRDVTPVTSDVAGKLHIISTFLNTSFPATFPPLTVILLARTANGNVVGFFLPFITDFTLVRHRDMLGRQRERGGREGGRERERQTERGRLAEICGFLKW